MTLILAPFPDVTIGIDYTPAYEQVGGIGRYVRELVAALATLDHDTNYRLFVAGANRQNLPTLPGQNFTWKLAHLSPTWFARLWHRAHIPIPIERWIGPVDLYHATDFVLPPLHQRTKTVLTVHDLSFARTPEVTSPSLKRYLDQVVPRSVHRADHVLADSEATRNDLIALYNVHPEKVSVLLSGVSARFQPIRDPERLQAFRKKYGLGDYCFVLAVGAPHPRKNHDRIIQAMKRLPRDLQDVHLVITGRAPELQNQERVHPIGFIDEADLPTLYSAARCLAFPSLYEGFGLPVLEAMACGTPALTSNVSSLIEVAGNAALMVDPLSVDEIAGALIKLLSDDVLRQQSIECGFQHVSQFTWERAARQLLALYQRVIED